MEKLSSTKVVLSAKKAGDNRSKEPERNLRLPLPRGQMARDLGSTDLTHCLRNWNLDKVLKGHEKGATGTWSSDPPHWVAVALLETLSFCWF